jgi:predicted 2-oxoglutarate/Fe(II)-dependent dioxygenase YbiX
MLKVLLTQRDDLFVVYDFLSREECERFIALSEATGYDDAPINALGGPVVRKDVRNNDRVMIDEPLLAAELWERLRPLFPEQSRSREPVGLNERFRFYRYDPGQQFDWHLDGSYDRSPTEQSAFTVMVYLNGGVAGGTTEFRLLHGSDRTVKVQPEAGKALVFPHRVMHRGAPVEQGRKYVLRTDVMCRWTDPE